MKIIQRLVSRQIYCPTQLEGNKMVKLWSHEAKRIILIPQLHKNVSLLHQE